MRVAAALANSIPPNLLSEYLGTRPLKSRQGGTWLNRVGDWVGIGEVAHWLSHLTVHGELFEAAANALPRVSDLHASAEELGQFISGRAQIDDSKFRS
jgi:hypothetical protein